MDGFATSGVNIGSAISYTLTNTNGDAQTQISLSGISALQNVVSGTTITVRLYGYGATDTSGGFAIGRLTGNDLAIGGAVAVSNTISGTVLDSLGNPITSGRTIKLIQNGTVSGTTATSNGSGVYTFTGLTLASGDRIATFIDGSLEKAVTVTLSGTSNITNFDLKASQLTVRTDNGGSPAISNTNLTDADSSKDADIPFTVTGSALATTAGTSLQINAASFYTPGGNINDSGHWLNNGTFTAGTNTVTFDGTAAQTIGGANPTSFATLTISPLNGAVVLLGTSGPSTTSVTTALNVSSGVFSQGEIGSADFSLTTNAVTVASGATWRNLGKGDVTLSGDVSNSGTITFNGNGNACEELPTNDIAITSTGAARTWSGTGTFSMTDVAVQNQTAGSGVVPVPAVILVTSGSDSGGNTRWVFPPTTCGGPYTWVGGANQSWIVPTNWSPVWPNAGAPTTSDILLIDGDVTPGPTITNVPAQTNAALRLVHGGSFTGDVTLQASGTNTLTLNGGAPQGALLVEAGAHLVLDTSSALTIDLGSSGIGNVSGLVILQGGQHRIISGGTANLKFFSGSGFTTAAGFSGNPFGATGVAQSVQFQSGSSANFNAGSDPFGPASPNGIASFEANSTANFSVTSAFSYDARTYGNLVLGGGVTYAPSASSPLTVNGDLTIDPSTTFTLPNTVGALLSLSKNFTDNGTFNSHNQIVAFNGSSLLGSAIQTVTKSSGPETFDEVRIDKTEGAVRLGSGMTINGLLRFDGAGSPVDVLELNTKDLSLNGTIGSANSNSGLKGDLSGSRLNIGGTGALGPVRFISGSELLSQLVMNRAGSATFGTNLTIGNPSTGNLTLTNGTIDMGSNTLALAAFPSITRTGGYVIGHLQKTFGAGGSFTFEVGTRNGYSPVDANVTAGAFPAALTASATQTAQLNITRTDKALSRYWTLTEAGDLTANLTFHYLDPTDIPATANESSFIIQRYEAGFTQPGGTVDANANTATIGGVTAFSDWTLADPSTSVVSLNRFTANPTNSATVTWQIVFANPVDALTASNFALVNTGLSGTPAISSVASVGTPPSATWSISASTGTGEGTLGLNMVNDSGVTHAVTNLTFTGQVFNIDHNAPSTTSFTRQIPLTANTSDDTLVFRATFSEDVTGVDPTDFAVSGTTATATSVTPVSASVYDVTVSGGDLAGYNGVVGLNFSGGENITDLAGNPLPNTEPAIDETYTLSNTPPCSPPSIVYVNKAWAGTTAGADPDGGAGLASNFGCDSFATIQEGINGVTANGTVNVAPGTYTENVVINKALTLAGSGKGALDTTNTVLTNSGGVGIMITHSDVTVSLVRVRDYTAGGHSDHGIELTGGALSNILIDHCAVTGTSTGVALQETANVMTNITVQYCDLIGNRDSGLYVYFPTYVNGLTIDNCDIENNAAEGIELYQEDVTSGLPLAAATSTNVHITNSTVSHNAVNQPGDQGFGNITIYGFNGDLDMSNVSIDATDAEYGIYLRGHLDASDLPTTGGTMTLTNVSVTGAPADWGMHVAWYTGVQLSFTDLTLNVNLASGATPDDHPRAALFMRQLDASNSFNLGNTILGGTRGGGAQHPYDLVASHADINATSVTFSQVSQFGIEDMVLHRLDVSPFTGSDPTGLVTWVPNNKYVTPSSASIQRAIDAANNGDTVNVKSGSYTENVSTAAKSISLSAGASPGQVTINGNLTLDSNDTLPIEINGTNPATDYDNFIVNGVVTLGGAHLALSGSLTPVAGQTFTIIDNDMSDSISGTFDSLPEGATITGFLGSGLNAVITYQGGTGSNNVVLTVVTPVSDLSITKSGPATVTEGNNFTYTLIVSNSNSATATATGVSVTDVLPAGVTFVSASAGCTGTGTVTCTGANIPAGGSDTFTITVNAGPPAGVSNSADASATNDPGSPHTSNSVPTTINTAVCTAPPAGMVAWYPGDGNADDVTGNGNSGTLVGNTTYAPGKVGQAYSLDGAGDAVSVGNPTDLHLQNFTIDAWVKPASASTISFTDDGEIFGYGLGGYVLGIKPDRRVFLSQNGISELDSDGPLVADTNFHHIAVTKNGAAVIFYVDGVASSTFSYNPSFTFTTNANIGAEGGGSGSFFGVIDELEIFNHALSPTEVANIYNASFAGKCRTCTAPPADMISWWAAEGNADDLAGPNNGAGTGVTYAPGKVGQAFSFDATDIVTIPNSPSLNPSGDKLTLDGWINPTANTTAFYFGRTQTSDHPYLIYFQAATPAVHIIVNSGEHSTGYVPPLNTWTHLAMVYDGTPGTGTIKLYANGVEVFSAPRSGAVAASSLPFVIGNRVTGPTPTSFNGLIDEVQLIDRALSPSEIAAIVNAGNAGKCHTSTIQLSSATYDVTEGNTNAVITVTRTGAHDTSASFHYATTAGSATVTDYDDVSGDLTFDPGQSTKTFSIPIHDDSNYEGDETVNVQLSAISGAGVSPGTPLSATLTIHDDETAPNVTINDVSQNEGSASGTTNFTFTVTLSTATQSGVTINYSTQDNTATLANTDYVQISNGSLVIPANQTTGQFSVQVNQDTTVEADETFFVNLTATTVGTITDSQGQGTIVNDDADVSVAVAPASVAEDGSGNLVYTFTRNGFTTGALTVNFSVAGSATLGTDYAQSGADTFTASSGTVTFGAGNSTALVTIDPAVDSTYEANETVVLTVTSGTGYNVSSPSAATGTITNDDPIPTTLIVTKTADTNDGFCTADDCSLREAISNANTNPDANTINFNIPISDPNRNGTTGVFTISPSTALPTITNPGTIDGYSQTPCSGNPAPCSQANTQATGSDAVLLIEIDGTNAGGYGLRLSASNSTIKGLVINRSGQSEIEVTGANDVISGNFLGTDAAGAADLGSTVRSGVEVNAANGNTIGGATAADRNVISGGDGWGIFLINGASGNTVQNNYIGSDKSGTLDRGNVQSGILIDNRTNNTILGNLISGNDGDGILIRNNSAGGTANVIRGNLIGTMADGTSALGNGGDGVEDQRTIAGSSGGNTIGGTGVGEANVIAFNGGDGVFVNSSDPAFIGGTSIRGNSIHSNIGLGIDLAPDGVTPNDAGDPDTGANGLQNFPIIRNALVGGPSTIRGTLNSIANQAFTIDLYRNVTCDGPVNGEGKTYLGSTTVNTGPNGDGLWSFSAATVNAGDVITATATDAAGNTSEFSACFTATTFSPGTISFTQANVDDTETNAGSHTVNFTVTRTGGSDGAVSVNYAVTNGTATTADNDYSVSPASGTLSWPNGNSVSKTITITVNGDTKFEPDEIVNLTLSNATGGAVIGTNPATLTIKNDDTQPAIAIDNVSHSEGNAGTTDYDFTVSLSNASYQTVTVNAATTNDTATTTNSDYTAVNTTLTFDPDQTTKHVHVLVNGDLAVESDEQFFVDLSAASNASIADNQGVGTIINDDTDVTISVSTSAVAEDGATNLVYTFTRSPLTSGPIAVNFSVGGTATFGTNPGDDYTQTGGATFNGSSGTVVIPNGATTATVTIDPTADTTVELDETVILTVTSGVGYNVGGANTATGTITTDDTDISVTVSPGSALEDGLPNLPNPPTNQVMVYTFTRTGVTSGAITVNFSVGGVASFPSDYAQTGAASFGPSTGTVTFGDGVTSATVTIDPITDATYESNETVTLTVISGTNYNPASPIAATGTITNDDPKPTLTIGDRIAFEGTTTTPSPTTDFVFTVTKNGPTEVTATVDFATADGTTNPASGGVACGGSVDYESQTGSLTFLANETSKTITVKVCREATPEANETFFVNLSNESEATITDGQGRGTIQNDDSPGSFLTVNTTDDVSDGLCDAHCTLRDAITALNGSPSPGAVGINFAIPANDPRHFYYADDGLDGQVSSATITTTATSNDNTLGNIDPDWAHSWWSILPTSALPAINHSVVINGYSQPGTVVNTLTAGDNALLRIELTNGNLVPSATGLILTAGTSTVRGLVINRWTSHGLDLQGGTGNSVVGNFIGTDVSGTLDLGNTANGISTTGSSLSVGGSTADAVTTGDINLISGNNGDGISFAGTNSDLVLGNLIGTRANGISALGNGGNGISFLGAGSVFNTVGGTQTGDGNTIAFNGGDGVQVTSTAGIGNSIRGNSIFSNGTTVLHLGIDLDIDGVTANDATDADSGPNNRQNFPVVTQALVTGSTKTIKGTLNSKVGETFDIDFYQNTACDTSGNGEGRTYLGSITTTATDSNGDVSFTFHPVTLTVGQTVTATATSTGASSSTSEFSACFPVTDGSSGAGDIQFTSATYTVGEAGGTAAITVTRVGGSNGSITANLSTSNGTAQAPGDYTAVSNFPITYVEGETAPKTINITIVNDTVFEGSETVNLSLDTSQINAARPDDGAAQLAPAGDPHAAVLTITPDGDAAPTLAIDSVTHNEGNSGTTAYSFTVTKTGATDLNASVDYATVIGSAIAPSDFTAVPTTTLTFLPADTTKQFTVLVNGDTTPEPDESFTVHLSNAVNSTISVADGTGTITNDDTDVSVAVTPSSVAEDGATNLVYTFTRNGVTGGALTVNFSVAGTATFGTDYTQSGAASFGATTGTVTFGAGNTNATVTLDPTADGTVELDETAILTLTSGAGYNVASPSSATGTITNDDTDVSVAVSPASVAEDGATNLVYTFTRAGVTTGALSVNFSVGGTATFGTDYTQTGAATFGATTGTVTFGAGNSTATVTIDPATDSTVEGDETAILTLTSGTGYNVASPSAATGTIANDDTDVSVAVSPSSVAEDGVTNLVYTFTRNGVTTDALTVNFSVAGTATFGTDYTQSGAATFGATTGTITFGAGNTTATVTVDPTTDSTVEANETAILTVTAGTGYNVASPSSATGTITNDDTDVSVAVSPSSVTEDGATNLVYTFTRNGVTSGALTVNFTVGGTATFGTDYTQSGAATFGATTGTVTIGAGNTTATVTVDPTTDSTVEANETAILTVTAGTGYNVASPSSATGTITNDDTDVSVAVSPSSVTEDGATNLVYTFTRNGVTSGALTVNFTVGGTATFGTDYTQSGAATFGAASGTVTFGAGNSTATVTIDPTTDSTVEPDENVILTVTSGAGYNIASPSAATGAITNDDTDVSVAVAPSSVAEDGATNLVYTFTRNGVTSGALTVNFSVGGTATFGTDYTQSGAATFGATSGTVTFGAGNLTATVTIDPTTDSTVEANETAILTVTSGTGYNVASPSAATGTITNDDTDVSIAVSPSSVAEDGVTNLVYTFTRNGVTSGTLTVNFTVGGTATFGTDYTQSGAATFAATTGTVTIGSGNTTATVTVDPTPDLLSEPNETAILTVTSGTGYNVASPSSATGTITNDDAGGGIIRFSSATYNTTESSGSTVITVERIGDLTQAVTVDYATPDDSAATTIAPCSTINGLASPRCDFTTAVGRLQFAAGEGSKTFTVLISQDNYVEGPETLTLTLSNPTGGAVFGVPTTATLTIADDASEPATNPIDDASNFVRQHYHDFLNREPDASGLAFWTNEITSCGNNQACIDAKRINVSAAFYISVEFQNTGYLVERLYKASYGDATGTSTFGGAHQLPVPIVKFSEFTPDTQSIEQGLVVGQPGWEIVLENNKQAFVADFVQRARFTTAYPNALTPAQFVDALFANAGVTPTAAERQAAIDEFGGAGTSVNAAARGRALRRVAENATLNQQEFNRAFVLMQYFGYLRRNPNAAPDSDHSGYDFWLTKLNQFTQPGDDVLVRVQKAEMVKAFIVSGEYRNRFGP